MALPGVSTTLRRAAVAPNPQDTASIPLVAGVCSAGPFNTLTTLTSLTDLETFGHGPAVEEAAEILTRAGGPVQLIRTLTTTASVIGSPLKIPAIPSSTTLYGGLLLPGADTNGEVFVTADVAGVSVEVLGGADGVLGTTVTDNGDGTFLVSIQLETNGMSVVQTTGTALAAEINGQEAAPYLTAVAQGTGASIAAVLAETAIEDGDLTYVARQSGVTVRHLASGNNTSLSVSVSTKAVTVNLATDGNGTPTSTAAQVTAALALSSAASLLVSATASGAGDEEAGIWGATAITYGSTAALTLGSPTTPASPVNRFDGRIETLTSGTVGGATPPTIRFSLDGGAHWSGKKLVPSSGIVDLNTSLLTSGVRATFTGVMEVGDLWLFSTTEPTCSISDLNTALDVAYVDTLKRWGFVTSPARLTRSNAGEVDTKAQAALEVKFGAAMLAVTDEGAAETHDQWSDALQLDYQGFTSRNGLLSSCAGHLSHQSNYSGIRYWSPVVVKAAARRAAIPVHEDLGKTDSGPIQGLGDAYPWKLLIAGADDNGGVMYHARETGVSIKHVAATGNSKPLLLSVDTESKIITVTLATNSSGVPNSTADDVVAAVNAVVAASKLVVATQMGTGNSVAGEQTTAKLIPSVFISHDEYQEEALHAARFITTRTYPNRPGEIYFTQGPTMADESETGWTLICQRDVGLSVARIASDRAFLWLNRSLPGIAVAESEAVPAGALLPTTAVDIEEDIGKQVMDFLFRPKTDGEVSASPYGEGDGPVICLRNYNFLTAREIRLDTGHVPLGLSERVGLSVTPKLPA